MKRSGSWENLIILGLLAMVLFPILFVVCAYFGWQALKRFLENT